MHDCDGTELRDCHTPETGAGDETTNNLLLVDRRRISVSHVSTYVSIESTGVSALDISEDCRLEIMPSLVKLLPSRDGSALFGAEVEVTLHRLRLDLIGDGAHRRAAFERIAELVFGKLLRAAVTFPLFTRARC